MNEKRFKLNIDSEWWTVGDNTIKVNEFGFRDDLTGEDAYRGLKQELTEEETVKLLNDFNDDCKNWEKSFKILCEENKELLRKIAWADECGVQWGEEYNKWIGDIND